MTAKQIKEAEADEAIERLRARVDAESGFRSGTPEPQPTLDFSDLLAPIFGVEQEVMRRLLDWAHDR